MERYTLIEKVRVACITLFFCGAMNFGWAEYAPTHFAVPADNDAVTTNIINMGATSNSASVTVKTEAATEETFQVESVDSLGARTLGEVLVTGQAARQRVQATRLGAENLDISKLIETPKLLGENDIIKSMTLMAGVRSEGDGAGGFEVRGGNASQNLIVLDGMTLYNPSHVMGIFSTFNDAAISRATLYKGPIPTNFGGATSAVLDASLASGDTESYHGAATVGLLSAKANVEGPIVRDKLSFAVTARRSYVDMFLKMVPKYRGTVMNFYDVTAKVDYRPSARDRVDLSVVRSYDHMAITDLMGLHWGNFGTSLNWSHTNGESWRFLTTGAYSEYTTNALMTMMRSDQAMTEFIRDASLNERVIFTPSENHTVEVGARTQLLRVKSGEFQVNDTHEIELRSGWQNALWLSYDGNLNERFTLSAGVRLSLFSVLTGDSFQRFEAVDEALPDMSGATYFNAEPRFGLKYNLSEMHNLKIGIGSSTQNTHAIRSSATTFPFDRYALTSATVKPERSIQYSAGYVGMTANEKFDWSAEVYYRDMRNIYDFTDGSTMFSRVNLESIILGGRGRSYGLELMARKNIGRLTGWVSYTLSHTQSKIPGINDNRWYNATNDRRHDVSFVAMYHLSDRWDFSASWIYLSGQPLTAPDVKYELDGHTCYYYSQRNGYKTPSTHRLDVSATYTRHPWKRFTSELSFGLINAYYHLSPSIVYFEDDAESPTGTRAVQRSMYGLLPSVSYTLKF